MMCTLVDDNSSTILWWVVTTDYHNKNWLQETGIIVVSKLLITTATS